MYEKKFEIIQSYLDRCDTCLDSQNEQQAKELTSEFVSVFNGEIAGCTQGLHAFHFGTGDGFSHIDDLKKVRQKLENYYADLKAKADDKEYDLKIAEAQAMSISNSNVNTNTQSIEISLSQVYDSVDNAVDSNALTLEDAEQLKDLLKQVEGAKARKDKGKVWDRVKSVLTFLADKGADALIAAGPYLINALQNIK